MVFWLSVMCETSAKHWAVYLLKRQDNKVTIQLEKYTDIQLERVSVGYRVFLIGNLQKFTQNRLDICPMWCQKAVAAHQLVPSNHDVAGEKLRHTGAPVPQHAELCTVTLEEAQCGAHQISQLHPPWAVLNGRWLLTGEEEPLENWRRVIEVPCSKSCGRKREYHWKTRPPQ